MCFHAEHKWRCAAKLSLGLVLICAFAGSVSYCSAAGDFFDSRATELESKNTLRELETVRETPDVKIPRPQMYIDPPLIIEGTVAGKKDAKLYYFSKYHTVDKLITLFKQQFVNTLYDNEGKPLPSGGYTADQIPATHQLIVSCPSVEHAQEVLVFLQQVDVPPIQVHIDCLVSEVYADHTLDWETTIEIQNLLGERITLGGKTDDDDVLLPAFPGAALRDVARSKFGLKTGYVRNPGVEGHEFTALVDVLISRGYLKILMNPSLEVVNGEPAYFEMTERVPLDTIQISDRDGPLYTRTNYVKIVDALRITPHVFADGYIGLETYVLLGSKMTPEGVKQVPIVTKREITITENRIRKGESLIIGGIRKSEQRSIVRGVPFLKDIPLLGILFSSKDFEERAKEILFIITPTISTGGVPNKDIVADIQRKHTPIKSSGLIENLKDPFGSGAYTALVEQEAIEAEVGRLRAEMEKAAADRKGEELLKQIATADRQVEGQTRQGERAVATAKTETAAAKAAIVAAKAQTAQTQAKIAAAQKLLAGEKARITAAGAEQKQATEAAKTAAAAKAAAVVAKAEAKVAKAAAEKAKTEAEARLAEWMKVKKANGG